MRMCDKKEDVFDIICNASILGNLGFFVGSGFTKAVLKDDDGYVAYSWLELLEKCCDEIGVDKRVLKQKGSYSEIASLICKQYAINNDKSYLDGVDILKKTISVLTNVYPSDEETKLFQSYFDKFDISWIVTTNYDTVLESIFVGRALPLAPNESFIKIKSLIPIYHIHGIRTSPESIIITNEDYVSLFRPNDYRQARLPFLIKESLVLMVGYGLGDINVITALDWSKNVYTNISERYDTEIVQLLYTDTPKDNPYRDESGVVIYEISDIGCFFRELNEYYHEYSCEYKQKLQQINNYINDFVSSDSTTIDFFIDHRDERIKLIEYIARLNSEFDYVYPSYIVFLKQVVINLNERAVPNGAFYAYDQKLQVLIDILSYVDISKVPPTFFSLLAESLNNVAYYVGYGHGESWGAADTWRDERDKIPQQIKSELMDYAKANKGSCYRLKMLLMK